MKATVVLGAVVFAATTTRCVVLSGGTGGYRLDEAGASGASCISSAECADAGGTCCLSVGASTAVGSAVGSCQPTCSGALPQLCGSSADCLDAGQCSTSVCNLGAGITFSAQTCGLFSGCNATD